MPIRHIRLAFLAWALSVAGPCAAQAAAPSVRVAADAILFDGPINPRSAAAFLQALQDPAVTRLVITSGGGQVDAALDMAFALHARQLDIEVPEMCHSSCANYLFPAARRKTLGRPDAVAWHGNMTHVLYLQQTGRAQWSDADMASARPLARREAALYRLLRVDGFIAWFGKIAPYDAEDFYYLSVPDMARFGIGNVSVQQAPGTRPARADVQPIRVDGDLLEARRPVVRLDE